MRGWDPKKYDRQKNKKVKKGIVYLSAYGVQDFFFLNMRKNGNKQAALNKEEGGTDILTAIALYNNNITEEAARHRGRSWHIKQGKDRTCKRRKHREKVTFEKTPGQKRDVWFLFFPLTPN